MNICSEQIKKAIQSRLIEEKFLFESKINQWGETA